MVVQKITYSASNCPNGHIQDWFSKNLVSIFSSSKTFVFRTQKSRFLVNIGVMNVYKELLKIITPLMPINMYTF